MNGKARKGAGAVPDTPPAPDGQPPLVPAADFAALLAARRFSLSKPPDKPVPLLMMGNSILATAGNLLAIQAQAKSGKSALVGAILAALMQPGTEHLGITSSPGTGIVLHFDTEQSPYDHHHLVRTALRRAKLLDPPDWLQSFCLTDLPLNTRRDIIFHAMENAHASGGLRAALIDGLGDIVLSPNDEHESNAILDRLHQAAIHYRSVIGCILHENPGGSDVGHGKTRGHLGSQLQRKAETNLRLQKSSDGITTVYTEVARHTHIPKEHGSRFAWNLDEGMHMPVATRAESKADSKRTSLIALLEEVFRDAEPGGMRRCDILAKIGEEDHVAPGTARDRFDAARKQGLLSQLPNGLYRFKA